MNRRERRTQWQASQRLSAGRSVAPAGSGQAREPAAPYSAIRMQVGELVLRGFEKRHASRIAAAFERRLGELLRLGELPAHLRQSMRGSSLRLAPLTLRRAADPVSIGEDLARSVFALERNARRRGGVR
jgi:hypothetical protein